MKDKKLWQQIFQYLFAALIAVGLYWVTYFLFMKEMPERNLEAGLIILGVVASAFTQVVGFFFGSSKGSSDKSDAINAKLNGDK